MRTQRLWRRLDVQLTAVFCGLVSVLGIGYVFSTLWSTSQYHREVSQRLNRDLARHIASERLPMRGGEVDREAIGELFSMLMVINPRTELYLLSPEGRILAFSAPPEKVVLERVELEPVARFLAGEALPILGDNPRQRGDRRIFSAARVPQKGPLGGYLYVVLDSEEYLSVAERVRSSSQVITLSLWSGAAGLVGAAVVGFLLFGRLTGRLRRLAARMEAHRAEPDISQEISLTARNEIEILEANFDRLLRRLEGQLKEREELDLQRRDLISNVSHDLRTPVAALRGYLETLMIKEGQIAASEHREYVSIAARHADRLARLIDELFELTGLDAADFRLQIEPFSFSELVQDNVQRFRLYAKERGVVLRGEVDPHLPFVAADIGLIDRALVNLMENAIHYTSHGGEVCVELSSSGDGVRFRVRDTGCGIAAEELPRIFDRFFRVKNGAAGEGSEGRGRGLGLAITKRILELHSACLEVCSTVGKGSTFSFVLPEAPAIAGTSTPPPSPVSAAGS